MYKEVSLQVIAEVETLPTLLAFKRLDSGVQPEVLLESACLTEELAADFTPVRLLPRMHPKVIP